LAKMIVLAVTSGANFTGFQRVEIDGD